MSKTVKLKHPSITSFSHDGEQYDAVKGVFDMPPQAAAVAVQAWGFTDASVPAKGTKGAAAPKAESGTADAADDAADPSHEIDE